MTRVLVTGCGGFIGRAVCHELRRRKIEFNGTTRIRTLEMDFPVYQITDINQQTDWRKSLSEVDVVLHLAGRAHVLNDKATDPLSEFRRVNVAGTINLAQQALESGARRFIFMSSIGVNGNITCTSPFNELSPPTPHADYAVSKLEAEHELRKLFEKIPAQLVIIRPPLVYGPEVPGNFRRLLNFVARELPLPLGAIHNQRSMIAVENLVDFLITCIQHPRAGGEMFLVADGTDISTPRLIRLLGEGMGKTPLLLPVPKVLLKFCAWIARRSSLYQQLCCSLQVDATKAHTILNWTPTVGMEDALRETAEWFKGILNDG